MIDSSLSLLLIELQLRKVKYLPQFVILLTLGPQKTQILLTRLTRDIVVVDPDEREPTSENSTI